MDLLHNKEQGGYKPVDLRHGRPKPNDNWPYHNHPTTPHDREFGIKDPKFERHIFIGRDDIFFDIDAQVQMVADARQKPDGSVDNSLVEGVGKFRPMFYRWIDKHIGIAKGVMSAFVLDRFKTTSMNSISDKDEIDIEWLMPEFWDDTVFDQLTNAVHDYVVNATLYEYFTISLTSKDPVTVDKRQLMIEALSDVKKYVNAAKPGFIHKIKSPL